MALTGVSPDVARPTALALNILVAASSANASGAAATSRGAPWPRSCSGLIPLAFLGGALPLAPGLYKRLVGVVLLFAAVGMALTARRAAQADTGRAEPRVPDVPALGIGAGIGLLSGLTGTGSGIFLSPVLLFAGLAQIRAASGMAAVFILGNSIAGLAGNVSRLASLPSTLPVWIAAVVVGALIASEIGNRRGRVAYLRAALSVVLVIAGLKLIFIG